MWRISVVTYGWPSVIELEQPLLSEIPLTDLSDSHREKSISPEAPSAQPCIVYATQSHVCRFKCLSDPMTQDLYLKIR